MKKHIPHYPGCCVESSRFLNKIMGLEEVAGYYLYPKKHGRKKQIQVWHAWNFNPLYNHYVDLTMSQFSGRHPEVNIIPVET